MPGTLNWALGSQNPVSAVAQTSVSSDTTETTLLVYKLYGNGTDTLAALYVNPTPGDTEPASADATYTLVTDGTRSVNWVAMRSWNTYGGSDTLSLWDEIRIADTWADAVPVPEPATVGLLALGGVALLRRRRR